LFEEFEDRDPAAAVRRIAAVPLGAFLVEQGYFTLAPFFGRVRPVLFWSIALVLLAGTAIGVIGLLRFVHRHTLDGRLIAWIVVAGAVTLLCGGAFLALSFPWL